MSAPSTSSLLQNIIAILTSLKNAILDYLSPVSFYAFPENGVQRYDFMTGGDTYVIDIQQGKINHYVGQNNINVAQAVPADSTKLNLPGGINNVIKSALIFVSDADTEIQVGSNTLFNDHKLYHIINNLDMSIPIVVLPPTGKVPNKIDLNFVLSSKSIMPYVIDKALAHTKKIVNAQVTTSGFADILLVHIGGYDQLTVALTENNVNDVKYQVLVSEDGVNWFVLPNLSFPVTILKNSYALFTTTTKWHFYRVQVADNVGGTHGSVTMQASPIR